MSDEVDFATTEAPSTLGLEPPVDPATQPGAGVIDPGFLNKKPEAPAKAETAAKKPAAKKKTLAAKKTSVAAKPRKRSSK